MNEERRQSRHSLAVIGPAHATGKLSLLPVGEPLDELVVASECLAGALDRLGDLLRRDEEDQSDPAVSPSGVAEELGERLL